MRDATVTSTQRGGIAIVSLHREHDISRVGELTQALLDAGGRVVIDLTACSFISGATVGLILGAQEDGLRRRAVAVVAPLGGEPRRTLDDVHLRNRLRIFATVELALVALARRPLTLTAPPRCSQAADGVIGSSGGNARLEQRAVS